MSFELFFMTIQKKLPKNSETQTDKIQIFGQFEILVI